MLKEECGLPIEMQKLEIEPIKVTGNSEVNPFIGRRLVRTKTLPPSKPRSLLCSCSGVNRNIKSSASNRQYRAKLLKEPVLQYVHHCCGQKNTFNPKLGRSNNKYSEGKKFPEESCEKDNNNVVNVDLNRLSFVEMQKRIGEVSGSNSEVISPVAANHSGPSCSQQALNPPCDITMDELASYFETMVHIPKKMSSMAEMMYI